MGNSDILNVQLAIQKDKGHYSWDNRNYTLQDLESKIFAIRFDKIIEPTYPSFLSFNGGLDYPLYESDGVNYLSLNDINEAVIFITFNNKKWQLVKNDFRYKENVGHILTDTLGNILPNRQTIKIEYFDIKDIPEEGVIKLGNPIWSMKRIDGIKGAINEYQWYPIYNDKIKAPMTGDYRITVNLWMNNIENPMREVGIRVGNTEDWFLQAKRLRHSFVIIASLKKGDSLVPEVYVDKMVTSDTINIEECNFFIEHLNTQELQEVNDG